MLTLNKIYLAFKPVFLISSTLNAMAGPDAIPLLRKYKAEEVPQVSLIDKQQELKKIIILERTPMEGAINYYRWFPFETKDFVVGKRAALILTYFGASTLSFGGFFLAGCLKASAIGATAIVCAPCAIPLCLCGAFLVDEACLGCGKSIASSCNKKVKMPAKSIAVPIADLKKLVLVYKRISSAKEQAELLTLNKEKFDLLNVEKDFDYFFYPLQKGEWPPELAEKMAKFAEVASAQAKMTMVSTKDIYTLVQVLYKKLTHRRTFINGLALEGEGYKLQVKDELFEAWLYHLKPAGSTVYLPGTSFYQKYDSFCWNC